MRTVLLLVVVAAMTFQSGCALPIYSGDPVRRSRQLIYTSENLRMITDEWERIWFLDQPSTLTPLRTHGGVI